MLYQKHCFIIVKTQRNLEIFLLGPTGISAVNMGATTIHSGLGIKPGIKLLGLNDKSKSALRNKLSQVKFLWNDINLRLEEIFMMIPEKAFTGLSVMTVGHFLQLPPVIVKITFSQLSDKDSVKHLLGLQLWHLFKYAE